MRNEEQQKLKKETFVWKILYLIFTFGILLNEIICYTVVINFNQAYSMISDGIKNNHKLIHKSSYKKHQ